MHGIVEYMERTECTGVEGLPMVVGMHGCGRVPMSYPWLFGSGCLRG